MDEIEVRTVRGALEAAQGEGVTIEGYAALFGVLSQEWGGFLERIEPGAFASSLPGDVWAFYNHDRGLVLGRTKNGTLKLAEDETGLRFSVTPPATSWAGDVVELIRRGDVDQMSFGFLVVRDRWEREKGGQVVRVLEEVKLLEVSPTAMAARACAFHRAASALPRKARSAESATSAGAAPAATQAALPT